MPRSTRPAAPPPSPTSARWPRSLAVLLDNPETATRMALAARDTVGKFTGALDRTLAALDPYLIQLRLGRA